MKRQRGLVEIIILVAILIIAAFIIRTNVTGEIIGVEDEDKYRLNDISLHDSRQDCWISSEGKVYDITLFLQIYPEDLSSNCGKMISLDMFPEDVQKIIENYEIGIIG